MQTAIPWHQTAFFHALKPEPRARLGQILVEKRVDKGQVLFVEGEACTGFYLLEEGRVRLWKAGPGGEASTLAVVGPGESFAEAAMFGGGVFPATAEALEAGKAAFLPRGPFLALLRTDPELCLQVIEGQALWLRRLTVTLERATGHSGADRLLDWLREAAQGRRTLRLPMAKKVLAEQLGMSPETLSRHLRALQERGVIQVAGLQITLGGPVTSSTPCQPHTGKESRTR